MAQFLAGNDSYIKSLHRVRLSKSLESAFTPVNAEHIMFDCLRFMEEKRRLSDVSSINMSPHNLVEKILRSELSELNRIAVNPIISHNIEKTSAIGTGPGNAPAG